MVEHLVQEYGIPREHVRVYARDATGAGEARSPQDRVKHIVAAYREYGAADIDTREAEWRGPSSSDIVD